MLLLQVVVLLLLLLMLLVCSGVRGSVLAGVVRAVVCGVEDTVEVFADEDLLRQWVRDPDAEGTEPERQH